MRIAITLLSIISLFISSSIFGDAIYEHSKQDKPKPQAQEPSPWFVGPLLTPSGHAIPNGHYNIEPYEFITGNFGDYDRHWHTESIPHTLYNVQTSVPIQIGMPARLDFTFTPQFEWNHIHGASHWVLNDMPWGFDFQILYDKPHEWWPAIKLALRANFPFGKYQKLDPNDKETDVGGTGSWLPGFGISMSHLYWWGGHIFFAPRFNIQYTIPNAVHVKGFNAYGGGHHTHGTAYPGQQLLIQFGYEISLNQRWALAGDVQYVHTSKTRFSGHKGRTRGVPNVVGFPSSEQLSIAPALEYNWSAYVGIIAGVWWTIAGRNAVEFASGVVAINIYK